MAEPKICVRLRNLRIQIAELEPTAEFRLIRSDSKKEFSEWFPEEVQAIHYKN